MTTDVARWDTIIEQLRGTCKSIHELDDDDEALFERSDFCAYIDQQIFLCTECGWWCEIDGEASADFDRDELTCRECCEQTGEPSG